MRLVRHDEIPAGFKSWNDYKGYMEFKSRRSQNALQQIEKESSITWRWAQKVNIHVLPIPSNILLLATEYYGSLPDDVGLVAYIRHNFSSYDQILKECENCFGRENAYQLIKERTTRIICNRLGLDFSVEYLYNSKMPWLVRKDYGMMMEMYR